jgi:hypothetical protein
MVASALLTTTVILLALGFFLMGELRFLIPYRHLIVHTYGPDLAVFSAVLFVNLFAAVYLACRALFLKDTGRKLAHLEKQLRTRSGVSAELSGRLED